MEIVDGMAYWDDEDKPVALGDREKTRVSDAVVVAMVQRA